MSLSAKPPCQHWYFPYREHPRLPDKETKTIGSCSTYSKLRLRGGRTNSDSRNCQSPEKQFGHEHQVTRWALYDRRVISQDLSVSSSNADVAMGEPLSVVWRVLSRRKTPTTLEGRERSAGTSLTVVDVTCLGESAPCGPLICVLLCGANLLVFIFSFSD